MSTRYIKIIAMMLLAGLFILSPPAAQASVPYKTFTEDHNRGIIRTQDAYRPIGSIEKIGDYELKSPSDIHIDAEDQIYIADTGNHRILVVDSEGYLKRIVGEGVLKQPTGVFVDDQGLIYAADSGANEVVQFDAAGNKVRSFGKPDSPLFGANTPYKPAKVAVDKRGNLYIVSEGTTNGIIQLSVNGDFLGFFGSNDTRVDLKLILQHTFFTKEQRLKLFKNIPNSPTNVTIDGRGLIYTVTQGYKGRSIKRLNISGNNLLPEDMVYDPLVRGIAISSHGNIVTVSEKGFIFEYDREGNLLFVFGGPDDGRSRMGLFVSPSGISVNSTDHLFVLDKERGNIQILEPAGFAKTVHEALKLYNEGYYVQSQEPWNRVLQLNNLFDLAHKGLAESYYKQQQYELALKEYAIAGDRGGYSNAFWEIRNRWLKENVLTAFFILIGLVAAWKLLKFIHGRTGAFALVVLVVRRVWNMKLIREVGYVFHFIRHPIDGFYGIKEENRVSALSATVLYLLFFVEYLISIYYTGFIFNDTEPTEIVLTKEMLLVFTPFALWVAANYLVSTINEGEGKFSEIYKATIYAFAPYLVFHPVIVLVSNALTVNDAFIYHFSTLIVQVWCIILLFILVKDVHDFTFKETVKNICMTLFGMLILLLVVFILYVLLDQVYDFVYSVIQEGTVRANL